ncbi:lipid-A-disaccharide synthase N-terminal domain-containing protein [Candidatus Sumerlaeota bacterium]|nr:lipid-A-disaccharide synthase N-terminal domain-containing protein [Candidatus Sumerlaeota bacterium]
MVIDGWTLFGFLANAFFTIRVLIQWISSERAKKCLAPPSYWWFSLAGAAVMIIYSLERLFDEQFQDAPTPLPMLIGTIASLVPYSRNLMLNYKASRKWHILSYIFGGGILLFCVGLLLYMDVQLIRTNWIIVGSIGSVIWYSRFMWQWIYAEKEQRSEFPISFWYVSLTGLGLNLIYSIAMGDIVFILQFIFNVIPISRNIMLMRNHGGRGIS